MSIEITPKSTLFSIRLIIDTDGNSCILQCLYPIKHITTGNVAKVIIGVILKIKAFSVGEFVLIISPISENRIEPNVIPRINVGRNIISAPA